MKQKITIYTVAEDGDENGTGSETFASQQAVEDWQRSVMTKAFEASEGGTYARNMKHHLDEGDIDAAWTIYEDKLKDPLTTYSFDETTLEIDIPIIDELMKALDDIESLPVDDEGSRTIPPGFLDGARALLARWERP